MPPNLFSKNVYILWHTLQQQQQRNRQQQQQRNPQQEQHQSKHLCVIYNILQFWNSLKIRKINSRLNVCEALVIKLLLKHEFNFYIYSTLHIPDIGRCLNHAFWCQQMENKLEHWSLVYTLIKWQQCSNLFWIDRHPTAWLSKVSLLQQEVLTGKQNIGIDL